MTPDDTFDDEQSYFYKRAEAELAMAQKTDIPEAVKAHYLIAGYYLDRVYGDTGVSPAPDGSRPHISEE